MTTTSHSCVSKVPLFATLGPRQQLEVARFANAVSRKAGETLQAPGDADPVLMVVHTGAVRVSRIIANGQEQWLRLLEPGDFSGEIDFVTGHPSGQHLVAETDVEVCQFRHRDLSALVQAYPDIALQMLQAVTGRLVEAERALTGSTHTDALSRVAHYLLELPRTHTGGVTVVYLPTTKRNVASLLGISPETLSRRLRQLGTSGLVTVDGSRIVLEDVDGLTATVAPQ